MPRRPWGERPGPAAQGSGHLRRRVPFDSGSGGWSHEEHARPQFHPRRGQLAYLLQTGDRSALFSGSSGYWPGIFADLRPDVAFLALAGRPNVSGEPYQGSSARFMLEQAETLGPGRVCFCHHDPLLPGFPGTDVTEAAALLEARNPGSHFTLEYAAALPLFR